MSLVGCGAGSGKKLITARLLRDFPIKVVSAGQLLREEVRAGTPLGMQAKKCVAQPLLHDHMCAPNIALQAHCVSSAV
jgi:adenylate kinase family enzyme